jgi:hypothetical protein
MKTYYIWLLSFSLVCFIAAATTNIIHFKRELRISQQENKMLKDSLYSLNNEVILETYTVKQIDTTRHYTQSVGYYHTIDIFAQNYDQDANIYTKLPLEPHDFEIEKSSKIDLVFRKTKL